MSAPFERAGIRPLPPEPPAKPQRRRGAPVLSALLLSAIVTGCLTCGLFAAGDPSYMDLQHCAVPPGSDFWFGTDTMGRDIFSMIWYGGRRSGSSA